VTSAGSLRRRCSAKNQKDESDGSDRSDHQESQDEEDAEDIKAPNKTTDAKKIATKSGKAVGNANAKQGRKAADVPVVDYEENMEKVQSVRPFGMSKDAKMKEAVMLDLYNVSVWTHIIHMKKHPQ